MWLLPHLSRVSSAAVWLYYRASRDGGVVPATGPVLLVGNHPNALLDPVLVSWAARRPIRFLAKAPLFSHPVIGWLVRASGSIPVYRQQDDPSQMLRNRDSFSAVYEALGKGSAVAIFPEGISHSNPGLTPLKTGAARIALGAAQIVGTTFPIIPVGLILREKDIFRSEAHSVVGTPIEWTDLAARGAGDQDAVRLLTERIERGMRAVTLNLEAWEDETIVRTAEGIWVATRNENRSSAAHVSRLTVTADAFTKLRASGDPRWTDLAHAIREHAQMLHAVGMQPADVEIDTGFATAARWAARRLTFVGAAQFALAALAAVLFWVPYRLTGQVARALQTNKDAVSTYKVLGGIVVFTLWIALLSLGAGIGFGWAVAVVAVITLPAIAIGGMCAAEHWQSNMATVRRWLMLRRQDSRAADLRDRQRELAKRLEAALAAHQSES